MFRSYTVFGLGVAAFALKAMNTTTGDSTYLVAAGLCLVLVYMLGVKNATKNTITALAASAAVGSALFNLVARGTL